MKNDEKNKEELNYKQAYYYLLNQTMDIIKNLMAAQRTASEICIDETISNDIEIDIDKVFKKIVDEIKINDKM